MQRFSRLRGSGSDPLVLLGTGVLIAALGAAGTLQLQGRREDGRRQTGDGSPTKSRAGCLCARRATGYRLPSTASPDGKAMDVVRQLCCERFAGRKAGTPGA